MNSIDIIPQKRPIKWSRVLFHISKCSGKIKRKFNPDIVLNKLDQEEVNIIMALIEKESGKFTLLRFFYKISIIVIIFSILVFISSLIFFFCYKKFNVWNDFFNIISIISYLIFIYY